MSYPPFESTLSIDGFVAVKGSGKEGGLKYQLPQPAPMPQDSHRVIVVIGRHKYYSLFSVQLVLCEIDDRGVKGPFKLLKPIDYVWKNDAPAVLRFYLAIIKFQTLYEKSALDVESLKALIANPLGYAFYWHNHTVSEKITPKSISAISIGREKINATVVVDKHENHYTVYCDLFISAARYPFQRVAVQFDHFVVCENQWYLCENINVTHVLSYFRECDNALLLAPETFGEFQNDVLSKMEMHVTVERRYLKADDAKKQAPKETIEKILYLSDLDGYVTLNPVVRYGETEIPVLSKKQIYHYDNLGNAIRIERDGVEEDNFIALLLKQRPEFTEQLDNPLLYFYVNKKEFLDEAWFLTAFEAWRHNNITILGFNALKDNKLSAHKGTITVMVSSGINWFNAQVNVTFGKQKASLRQVRQAVRNKSKYVQLDDGTFGIIPEAWLKKFSDYFQVAEATEGDTLKISKNTYPLLTTLYHEHELQEEVKAEVTRYHELLNNIRSIPTVAQPADLFAQLRPYQHEGLNWLNFMDDANFGACLADDMGLGKSLQIIAFILALAEKRQVRTHLLVVPATLIYTWQQEFKKFAPGVNLCIHHGASRSRHTGSFAGVDAVITSYGTLTADIAMLREYMFEYIFLDESQNIKNPGSQRYQAARLLQSRNKIIISGTPLENNTFDLFAQFSFACPGLLGNRRYFRDTFAIPIDKFKSKRTLHALQTRITPFILRRTKQEVARDLPDKTEMVIYCDMEASQRSIYNRYEKEFREYISAHNDEEILKSTIHVLKGLMRLRQICNSPLLLPDGTDPEGASTKIEMLMERIISLTGNHKILVFSQFVSMLDIIKTRLMKASITHAYLTGSTRNRQDVVNEFQNNEAMRVFLISLKVGGTGLNLTAADYVFIVDPWWNPAVENQAIDRIHRIGQHRNVVAVRFICKDTIEEKIMVLQQTKTKLTASLIPDGTSALSQLTKTDILQLAGLGFTC
jgi:SNF2 family DNA or RNA helicase